MTEKTIPIPKAKRFFDMVFSFIFLIVLSPFFALILLAIFIEHILRGRLFAPLFYVEKRISQGNEINFIKFNIFKPEVVKEMRLKHEFIHTKDLEKDIKSLIFIGKLLQKVYLDELPQLIGILKGDLSFVGPRPVNLEVYNKLLAKGVNTKTIIRAGLTGSYQSQKGDTNRSDVDLDQEYIDFCREMPGWKVVLLDIKIIFRTFLVIFRAEGI